MGTGTKTVESTHGFGMVGGGSQKRGGSSRRCVDGRDGVAVDAGVAVAGVVVFGFEVGQEGGVGIEGLGSIVVGVGGIVVEEVGLVLRLGRLLEKMGVHNGLVAQVW